LRQILALVASLAILAGCGSPASGSPAPQGSSLAGDVTRFFAISEIGLGSSGWVTLHNFASQPANLRSGYLCQGSGCVQLPDVVVGPGEDARIAVGDGSGLKAVAMTGARLTLTPANGEVALFASSDRTDSGAIRAYLEWGSSPHDLTKIAIDAGLWRSGTYAPSGTSAVRLWKNDQNLWVWDAAP
jgi:hypothetical protein